MTINPETELLPPDLKAGYVYNRILRAIGDQAYDQDRYPDGVPAQGTVTFRPNQAVKQVATDFRGTTVTREPVICTIYDGYDDPTKAGELVDEAGHIGGVWLAEGTYTVSYSFTDRYSNVPDQEITVTDEYTEENPLDVALEAGLTPSPTIKFVVNEQIYLDSLQARNEAEYWAGVSEEMATVGPKGDLPVHVSETPPEDTDVIWVNPSEPSVTPSEYALEASQYADRAESEADRAQGVADLLGELTIDGEVPITVDTSVGTRVFVGDTMIHGDTGLRDITSLFPEIVSGSLYTFRENRTVKYIFRNVIFDHDSTILSKGVGFLPLGFRGSSVLGYQYEPLRGRSSEAELTMRITSTGGTNIYGIDDRTVQGTATFVARSEWPTSLPGTPA